MQVLRQHAFSTQTKSVFSLIKGGFIPGFDARNTAPVCQRVLVVENPERPVMENSVPGSFISEAIVDDGRDSLFSPLEAPLGHRCTRRWNGHEHGWLHVPRLQGHEALSPLYPW